MYCIQMGDQGFPSCAAATRAYSIFPEGDCAASNGSAELAVTVNKVLPSSPPNIQAKHSWLVCTRSTMAPPSATNSASGATALASHTRLFSSKQIPSGKTPSNDAHTRRCVSVLSAAMVKAVRQLPSVSATINVDPSAVMTLPLGNCRSLAAQCTAPSASTRTKLAVG